MKRILRLACSTAIAMSGCGGEAPRSYEVTVRDTSEHQIDGGVEFRSIIDVKDVASGTKRPVQTTVRSLLRKGPRTWEVETFNLDGQRVVIEHDDARKIIDVTVDAHEPVTVRQREDGKYEYEGKSFRDTEGGLRDLGHLIADDLEVRRVADDSVIAGFEASRMANEAMKRRGGKLFFGFAFVDVYTTIEANMNIQIGANNTNTM